MTIDVIKVRHLLKAELHSVESRNKIEALTVQMFERVCIGKKFLLDHLSAWSRLSASITIFAILGTTFIWFTR